MRVVALLCVLLPVALPRATAAGCMDTPQGSGHVAEIMDGTTLRMDDGAEIRLAGVVPFDDRARAALSARVLDKDVTLYGDSDAPDRYGRQPAFVAEGGTLVQRALLEDGALLASGTVTDRACAQDLAAGEAAARRARRGIWNAAGVIKKPVIPGDILAALGRFVVVEGRVLSVREAGATTYLNFGRRWTEDFAVTISRRMMPAFAGAGIALKSLERRRIRVRGWVEGGSAPHIEARHLGQIEAIGDD